MKKLLILVLFSVCLTIPSVTTSHADVCGTIKSEGSYISKYKGDWYAAKFAKRQYAYFELLLKNPKCSTQLDRVSSAKEMVRMVSEVCAVKQPEFFNGYGASTSKWLCNWASRNEKYRAR
jgi:hypothetical protein